MADTANLIRATSNLPQVLVAQFVAATETTQYQCPASKATVIQDATVCNSAGTGVVTVQLSVCKSGQTAGTSNRVAIIPLDVGESVTVPELVRSLGPGDFISAVADSASKVALVVSGAVSS